MVHSTRSRFCCKASRAYLIILVILSVIDYQLKELHTGIRLEIFLHLSTYCSCIQCSHKDISFVMHLTSICGLISENPVSAELDGEVGCCNLLVRAVETVDDVGNASWSYVAQELRRADSIDGSLMQMILTHRSAEADVCSRPDDESFSVKTLLRQLPVVSPASLSQLVADPTALPDLHRECVSVVLQMFFGLLVLHEQSESYIHCVSKKTPPTFFAVTRAGVVGFY